MQEIEKAIRTGSNVINALDEYICNIRNLDQRGMQHIYAAKGLIECDVARNKQYLSKLNQKSKLI